MSQDNQESTPLDVDAMLTELNLDTTEENKAVMSGLLKGAQDIVADSFTKTLSASMKADPIYLQAVKALVTAMYYDRSLSQGVPLGVRMMIDHLKGRYAEWPTDNNNGKE